MPSFNKAREKGVAPDILPGVLETARSQKMSDEAFGDKMANAGGDFAKYWKSLKSKSADYSRGLNYYVYGDPDFSVQDIEKTPNYSLGAEEPYSPNTFSGRLNRNVLQTQMSSQKDIVEGSQSLNAPTAFLNTMGQVAQAPLKVAGDIAGAAYGGLSESTQGAIEGAATSAVSTIGSIPSLDTVLNKIGILPGEPVANNLAEALQLGVNGWLGFRKAHPNIASQVESTVEISDLLGLSAIGKKVVISGARKMAPVAAKMASGVAEGATAAGRASMPMLSGAGKVAKPVYNAAMWPGRAAWEVTKFGGRTARNLWGHASDAMEHSKFLKTLPRVYHSAIRSGGLPQRAVLQIGMASGGTKDAFRKMLKIENLRDISPKLFQRSALVPGETINKMASGVAKARKSVGASIGELVGKMPDELMDMTDVHDEFVAMLGKRGIQVDKDGALSFITKTERVDPKQFGLLPQSPAPKTSKFLTAADGAPLQAQQEVLTKEVVKESLQNAPGSDLAMYQSVYDKLKPNMRGKLLMRPKRAHELRTLLFHEFDMARGRQMSMKTFSDLAEADADGVRGLLMKKLSGIDGNYTALEERYAQIMKALGGYAQSMGMKGKVDDLVFENQRAGEIARRLLSKTSARPEDMLDTLEEVAKANGMSIDSSIREQVEFADLLEELFGTDANTLQGQTARAVKKVPGALVSDRGFSSLISEGISPTARQRIRALQKLLDPKTPRLPQSVLNQSNDAMQQMQKLFPEPK